MSMTDMGSPAINYPHLLDIDPKLQSNFYEVRRVLEGVFGTDGAITASIAAIEAALAVITADLATITTAITTLNGDVTTLNTQVATLQLQVLTLLELENFITVSYGGSNVYTLSAGTNNRAIDSANIAFPITVPSTNQVTVRMDATFVLPSNVNVQLNWFDSGGSPLGAWATVGAAPAPPTYSSIVAFSKTWLLSGLTPGPMTIYPAWNDDSGGSSGASCLTGTALGPTESPFVMSGYPS
jgi:hypothetical protein